MDAITSFEEEKYFLITFNVLENYDDIEKIAMVLESEVEMKVLKKNDGPDSRIWYLKYDGEDVLLINNDPYGSYLRGETIASKVLLKQLLPRLKTIFSRFVE